MTAYVSRLLTHNLPCWSEYLVPNPCSIPTASHLQSMSGPGHFPFSSFQLHTHSRPRMCICASSHAHTQLHTHTRSLGPKHPCLLPKGNCARSLWKRRRWASVPGAQAGRGGLAGQPQCVKQGCWRARQQCPGLAPPFQEAHPSN